MTKITESNTIPSGQAGDLLAEASDLRFPVGRWPQTLPTDLGNGQPLRLTALTEDKGVYRQDAGILRLTVFND